MAKHLKFIDFTELSEDLKNFIQAGAKIFPVDTVESLPTQKDKDFYRILGGTERNNIYSWDDATESYKLIGADDKNVYWDEIKSKPATYQPATHTHAEFHAHNNKSVIDAITSIIVDSWNSAVTHISDAVKHITSAERTLWNTVSNKVDKITGKGLSTNDFTDVDKSKLAELHTNASMDYTNMNNALQTHKSSTDHDGRYYTKTEIDASLSSKAPKSTMDGHIASSTIHVTQTNKDNWNSKAESNHSHNYLPLTGGTLSGDLKTSGSIFAKNAIVCFDNLSQERFKFSYNGSTGRLELWRFDSSNIWNKSIDFTHRNGTLGVTIEGQNVVLDNDSRLTNARVPIAHTHTLADVTDSGNLSSINTNSSTSNYLRGDGTWVTPPNTTYSAMSVAEGTTGTVTTGRIITASDLKSIVTHYINTVPSSSTYPVLNTTEPSGLTANQIYFLEV